MYFMKHKRKLKQTCRVLHRNPKILKYNAWKFSRIKKTSTVKEICHSQENFHQVRKFSTNKFSTNKEIFYHHGNFLETRKLSSVKEFFHNRGNVPQTKIFTQSKICANKDQKDSLKANTL